ncbi:MAG TPA: hypothetical protein VD962_09085 [Rubricoccaceae bacterium]|nr:hypothetical protein [Rubricoccaceae bacterium]
MVRRSALVLAVALTLPLLAAPMVVDLSGTYNVTGMNPDGSAYEGTLSITRDGGLYRLHWVAGAEYHGVGLEAGGFFAAAYGAETCGVVAYRIGEDGSLSGTWGYLGGAGIGTEQATRDGRGRDLGGTYAVTGTNPDNTDGSPYEGTLTITPHGDVYELTWETGATSVGVGLRDGDMVAATYGGEDCGVVAYRSRNGGLEGTWATYGSDGIGTERASR